MKTLSNAKAPLITSWPEFGVFSVRAGDSVAMPCSVRGVASASTSFCLMLSPTTEFAIGPGVSATTWTLCVTPAACSLTFCSTVPPSGTPLVRFTASNEDSSNAIS
jgi:hypothetical protein